MAHHMEENYIHDIATSVVMKQIRWRNVRTKLPDAIRLKKLSIFSTEYALMNVDVNLAETFN